MTIAYSCPLPYRWRQYRNAANAIFIRLLTTQQKREGVTLFSRCQPHKWYFRKQVRVSCFAWVVFYHWLWCDHSSLSSIHLRRRCSETVGTEFRWNGWWIFFFKIILPAMLCVCVTFMSHSRAWRCLIIWPSTHFHSLCEVFFSRVFFALCISPEANATHALDEFSVNGQTDEAVSKWHSYHRFSWTPCLNIIYYQCISSVPYDNFNTLLLLFHHQECLPCHPCYPGLF